MKQCWKILKLCLLQVLFHLVFTWENQRNGNNMLLYLWTDKLKIVTIVLVLVFHAVRPKYRGKNYVLKNICLKHLDESLMNVSYECLVVRKLLSQRFSIVKDKLRQLCQNHCPRLVLFFFLPTYLIWIQYIMKIWQTQNKWNISDEMIIYDQGNYRLSFPDYFEHFIAALLLFHTLAPCGSSVPSNNTALLYYQGYYSSPYYTYWWLH